MRERENEREREAVHMSVEEPPLHLPVFDHDAFRRRRKKAYRGFPCDKLHDSTAPPPLCDDEGAFSSSLSAG